MTEKQKQLRFLFSVISGSTPKSGNVDFWDGDIPWITPEDISALENYHLADTRRKITRAGYESCGTMIVPPKSIVLSKRAPIGQLAILANEACSNQGCFLLTPRCEVDTRYYYYWLTTKTEELQALGCGSTFMELGTDELKSLKLPCISHQQESAIADFLDLETTHLDALLAAKEHQLELLAEKRRAIITNLVTRGMNMGESSKETGIEWLGRIPKSWEIKRVKYLFRLVTEAAPEDNNYELLALYTDTGVRPRKELEARGNKSTTTDNYWMVRKGDLVVNKLLAWMGAFGVSDYEGVTSPAYDILRPINGVNSTYYHHLFRCGICFSEFRRRSSGIMDMRLRLYFDQLGDMKVPVPSTDEQNAILIQIKNETSKLDTMHAATKLTIALLKERRAALIEEAVMGKIDVQGEGRQSKVAAVEENRVGGGMR